MKKWALLIILLVLLGILILQKNLTQGLSFKTDIPYSGVMRVLTDTSNWSRWWPGKALSDTVYQIGDRDFLKGPVMLNGISFKGMHGNNHIQTTIQFLSQTNHQTSFDLATQFHLSGNPIVRVRQYVQYLSWKKEFNVFADSIRHFFQNQHLVYGVKIEKQKVPNSEYLAISEKFDSIPSWNAIYKLIDEIQQYVFNNQAQVTNDPLYHLVRDGSKYQVMVALATSRGLPGNERIVPKQMALGNILVAEVRGGPASIEKAQNAMENYLRDYRKSSPAIPFERLITDRRKQNDTAQWITKINYPIFE